MAAQAQSARFYPGITSSKVLVKVGETKIPGDLIGGVESVLQSLNVLMGWTIAESTGTASAKIRLWDGLGGEGTGSYLGTITLGENESNREWFGKDGPELKGKGIYVEVVSGKIEGVVNYG
jgi:hypothetical protein